MQFQRRQRANRLIIFVHGFTGTARETWTHDRTQAYWPELIAADEAFGEVDIAVYSYSSSVFEQNFSIDEVADNLRLRMMAANIPSSYKEVVFLAHSMGGLIVRAFALKYRDLVKIPMVYFFATPTNGSDLANIASLLTSNSQAEGLRVLERNLFLQSQNAQWLASSQHMGIRSYCAYETRTTRGVTIVPRSSATALCNQRLDPIPENHIRIVKPDSVYADAYVAFKVAYEESFERQQLTNGQTDIEIDSNAFQFPGNGAVLTANKLTISAQDYVAPYDALIVANSIEFKNGGTLRGVNLSIVTGSTIGGTIDVSGAPGKNAGELLIATGRILGTRILASGGAGVKGTNGQDGIDGGPGSNGGDGICDGFDRWRSARAGGDGTAGSDGTDGANGGDGGNGGTIYLLALSQPGVQPDVRGGEAGLGGEAGRAGRGGKGGKGGRGCTGLGGSQSNAIDGNDGLDGRPGRRGASGNPGRDGTVWIKLIDSLTEIAQHIPKADEVVDYKTEIIQKLKAAARTQ